MRVAYLTSLYPAVSHTFIRREVKALRASGIEVHTFSVRRQPRPQHVDPEDDQAYETTEYLLPVGPGRLLAAHVAAFVRRPLRYLGAFRDALKHRAPGARALLWGLFYFAEAIVLARSLERLGVRHVHCHFANVAGTLGFIASRFLGIGWSVTLHGDMDFDYPSRLLLEAKAAAARFVVCVSYFGRAQAMRVMHASHWPKLVVVRCGVDTARFTPPQRRANGSRLRVLTIGRLSPEKGQLGLIEAFASLLARGVDAELRIIGDGPLRGVIEKEIQARNLGDRCLMLGQKAEADVVAELEQADVFALSSFLEGLPVVLMEALAMEVAVVAPSVAGIPELVEHERSGLLFAPSHWDGLRAQLERLLSDADLRARLGSEGRRRVEAEFDSGRAVTPLVERFAPPV
jgi:glycosyltransferase involved in cell wall biosynthesis